MTCSQMELETESHLEYAQLEEEIEILRAARHHAQLTSHTLVARSPNLTITAQGDEITVQTMTNSWEGSAERELVLRENSQLRMRVV